jgi:medium-chain acyl-[acyl-carrier-protein] hydrolase
VCFSHAGGSAAQYRDWQHCVPSEIEVQAVQLPGRANRFNELPLTSIRSIAAEVASALRASIRRPVAFFGHSVGALIAFEVAVLLKGMPILMLIAAGARAPHLRATDRRVYDLSDIEFREELRRLNGTPKELLEDEEAMKVLGPALRGDFQAIETYIYQAVPPLQCPIAVFGGHDDSSVTRDDLKGWQRHTSSTFTLQMFPGDHFFVNSSQRAVIHEIVGLLGKRSCSK